MVSLRWARFGQVVLAASCQLAFGDASNVTLTATTTVSSLISRVTRSDSLTTTAITTTSFVSGVTPSAGNETFRVGQDVYALYSISYGTTSVPAGTAGVINSIGTRVVINWGEPHSFLGEVKSENIELKPCFDSCDGLLRYIITAGEIKNNVMLTLAEQCVALQNYSHAAACALAPPRKTCCQNSWSALQGHAEPCTTIGVNITMDRNDTSIFQPILRRVVAIVRLQYTFGGLTIDIPAGAYGQIIERGEQRIVVRWDVPEASALQALVTPTQIEYATCMAACEGMKDFFQYEKQFRAILGEEQMCLAIAVYANASTCVLAARSYRECSTLRSLLGSAVKCSNYGGTNFVDSTLPSSSPRPYTSTTPSPSGTTTTLLVEAPTSQTGLGSNRTSSGQQFDKAIAVAGTQKKQTPIWILFFFLGCYQCLQC